MNRLHRITRTATSRPLIGWLTFITTILTLIVTTCQGLAMIPLRRALNVRRCTGAVDCRACTSCTGCAHCRGRHGSCGVCRH